MWGLLADSRKLFVFIVISLLLGLGDYFHLFDFLKTGASFVSSPIQYGLYRTYLSGARQFEYVFAARRSAQENKALNEQLSVLYSENANLRRKLAETQGFLEQEKTLSPLTFKLVAARPIGMTRYLRIDKGSNEGILVGQVVVYKDNMLGKVLNVNPTTSEVALITDPDSKVAAFVSGEGGKAKGILQGQFGTDLLLDRILHQEQIAERDIVYTEGTEDKIPRGLILGLVTQVDPKENEVFKQAKVKTVFNVSELEVVFVITE